MSTDIVVPVTTVPIKSAWSSKVNITQAVGVAATALTLLTGNKYSIPLDVQVEMVAVIQGIQALVSWVLRTWFTTSMIAGSVSK